MLTKWKGLNSRCPALDEPQDALQCGQRYQQTTTEFLLDKTGLLGTGFGAPGHIRFSFAVSQQTLEKALERMGAVLNGQ